MSDGSVLAEFCIGDGIGQLQTDRSGCLWVGYFDEGVYGNRGWGMGPGSEPIGRSGLVCFDREGRKLWDYQPPEGFDEISDCYALNCTDDAVWACYYTGFPIIRIVHDFKVSAFLSDVSGPRQMAVNGDRLMIYGGYRNHANDCWLIQLRESAAERVAQIQLQLPDGAALDKATVLGRDRFLHVFAGDLWYRFEVPRG